MRAREFARESFDRPYTLRWDRSDSEYEQHAVAMTDSGDRIVITFSKESTSAWSVEFTRGERISQTGTGDSPRVFATVLAAIQQFVKKQEPNMLVFTAVKSEAYSVPKRNDSRIKLYDRMIQRFAPAQGYQVEKRDLDQTVLYVLKRSDQPNPRVMENQTLEQYRQIALREIQQWSETWRKAAEQNLGINIHRVSAVGSVTDPKRFTEDSDIDVAFYYSDPKKPQGLDEQLSEKLQQVFMQYAHRDLGVINTLVYNKL